MKRIRFSEHPEKNCLVGAAGDAPAFPSYKDGVLLLN